MTVRIYIKVKGKDVPDFGLGKGVLSYQDVTYPDDWWEDEGNLPMKVMQIHQHATEMMKEVVEYTYEPIKEEENGV